MGQRHEVRDCTVGIPGRYDGLEACSPLMRNRLHLPELHTFAKSKRFIYEIATW